MSEKIASKANTPILLYNLQQAGGGPTLVKKKDNKQFSPLTFKLIGGNNSQQLNTSVK